MLNLPETELEGESEYARYLAETTCPTCGQASNYEHCDTCIEQFLIDFRAIEEGTRV